MLFVAQEIPVWRIMLIILPGSLHSDPLGQMDISVKTMIEWGTKGEKGPQQPCIDDHKLLRRPTWEAWVSGFQLCLASINSIVINSSLSCLCQNLVHLVSLVAMPLL